MKNKSNILGHTLAFLTIILWGTTFTSTKILLDNFSPVEIIFLRFFIGFIALCIASPKIKFISIRDELSFIFAGLCGVTLYFLFENIALTKTLVSNVGVIVSTSPFFTGVLASIFLKKEKLTLQFILGFILALIGICIISFQGTFTFDIKPVGDILALLAAFVWAVYSIITKKISDKGYGQVDMTKRIFFYGIILMIPFLFFYGVDLSHVKNISGVSLGNIIYLGIGASAICYATWGYALQTLGAIKTSVYIYLIPVVTIATSIIILDEKITSHMVIGSILILFGLFISERKK